MPQELHVLRCYSCKTFQVQIVKKVPKWQCKICNEKQSVLKVYAKGSGKDCRQYVQDLNLKQGQLSSAVPTLKSVDLSEQCPYDANDDSVLAYGSKAQTGSKWSEYLEEKESKDENCYATEEVANKEFHSSLRKGGKKGSFKNNKWNEFLKDDRSGCDVSDNQNLESFEHSVCRGSKRKHNDFEFSDEYAGDVVYQEEYLPRPETDSGYPRASYISNASDKLQCNRMEKNPSASNSSVTMESKKSKWSEFIVSEEENNHTAEDFSHRGNSFQPSQFCNEGTQSIHRSPILPCEKQPFKRKPDFSRTKFTEENRQCQNLSLFKDPFHTTDDENLDSLLDL